MTRNILRVLCFVLSICASLAGTPLYAETDAINSDVISGYGLRNLENAVIIHATPATPSAGETVHFTVEGPVYDLPKDVITWTINGKSAGSGTGLTKIDANVNAKGDPITVTVNVMDSLWGAASNALTLIPLQLDILYDAPTYVPPFYRGRALPSAGGIVRLQAIARFIQNGKLISNSSIRYTWSRNGTVLGNISGLGKSDVNIDTSTLYGANTISVKAVAGDESLSANASVTIADSSPVLALYEDHPLFGVTYFNGLSSNISAGSEMTVAAIPYFATVASLNDPSLEYDWLLNNVAVTSSSTKRNEITIDADHDTARVHLEVTSTRNFFMSAASDWKFSFGSSGGSTITKPGAGDAFHNGQP